MLNLSVRKPFFAFVFIILIANFDCCHAQAKTDDAGILRSEDGATTIYRSDYFSSYSPINLQDMLQRIPGASISDSVSGQERRGLRGNEDAILINGQQVTGKDSGGASALQRIAADQVERIEIIRGSTSEVQSTSQRIINVILREDAGETLTVFVALPVYSGDGSVRPISNVSFGVNEPNRNYTIAFNSRATYRPWVRTKDTLDLVSSPLLASIETEQADSSGLSLSGRYEQLFPGGSRLQLNGLIDWSDNDRERREVLRASQFRAGFNLISDVLEDDHRDTYTAELSADYSFPIGQRGTVTLLGLYNWEEENKQRDVFDIAPLDEIALAREDRLDTRTESIVRGVFDYASNSHFSVQVGVEGTINTQKTDFDLSALQDGVLRPVSIFNSDGKVTEYRGEGFSTLRWRPSSFLEAEIGIAVEASRIKQNSTDVNSARSLIYAKPNFSAYWNITPADKVFLTLTRDVGQLNFSQFVASILQVDQELVAGNPDINPVRSWDYELGIERRLAGGGGVVSGRLFYRDVQDVRGRITFDGVVSQNGNIGAGKEYGFDSEFSFDFSRLGWWDGVLTTSYLRRQTTVIDPIEQISRRFGAVPNWEASADYRHEIRSIIDGFISLNYSQTGARFINDIDTRDRLKTQPSLLVNIEHRLSDSLRINFSASNILNRKESRVREIFDLLSTGGRELRAMRFQQSTWGRIYSLGIRGTF